MISLKKCGPHYPRDSHRALFSTRAHSAYFVFAGQSKGMDAAHRAFGEVRLLRVAWGEQKIARAHVNAAARNGGAAPHRRQVDFLEDVAPCEVQSDQLVAHSGGEIRHAVGKRDARGDRIADIGVRRLIFGTADRFYLGTLMPVWSKNSADLDLLVAIALAMRSNGPTQPQKSCKVEGAEISALDSPPISMNLKA